MARDNKNNQLPFNITLRKHNAMVNAEVVNDQRQVRSDEIKPITSANDNKVLFACVAKMQLRYKDQNYSAQQIEEEARAMLLPKYLNRKEEIERQLAENLVTLDEKDAELEQLKLIYDMGISQEARRIIKKQINPVYEFDIDEIIKLTGISSTNTHYLRKKITALQFREAFRIKEYAVSEDLSSFEEETVDLIPIPTIRTRKGKIAFELNPSAIPYFFALTKNFTQLSLDYIKVFSSNYTIRLYEIAMMIRKIQKNQTYSFDELQRKFGTNYGEYRFFKAKVLKVAMNEINEKTDIIMDIVEQKSGRIVEKISFKITSKKGSHVFDEDENDEVLSTEDIARFITLRTYFKRLQSQNEIKDVDKYNKRLVTAIKEDTIPTIIEDTVEARKSFSDIKKIKKILALEVEQTKDLVWDNRFMVVRTGDMVLNSYGYVRLGDTASECLKQIEQRLSGSGQTFPINDDPILTEDALAAVGDFFSVSNANPDDKEPIVIPLTDQDEDIWYEMAKKGFTYKSIDGKVDINEGNLEKYKDEMVNKINNGPHKAKMYFVLNDIGIDRKFNEYLSNL